MVYSRFFKSFSTNIPNEKDFSVELTKLAKFIQTPANEKVLFSSSKGGEIDFSSLDLSLGTFNVIKDKSTHLLDYALNEFKLKLNKLQTIDFKLTLSFTLGLVAIALAPLSMGLSALLSASVFGYFGYLLKTREVLSTEYKIAQQDITNVYIWALNDTKATIAQSHVKLTALNQLNVEEILDPKINNLLNVINPMLSDQNIMHFVRNDIDQAVTVNRNNENNDAVENETTSKLQLSLSYLLYGLHQGSNVQIAKGIFELTRRSATTLLMSLKESFADDNTSEQPLL